MADSSSISNIIVQGIPTTLSMAREYTLLGNYATALVFYTGALENISQYLKYYGGSGNTDQPFVGNNSNNAKNSISSAILNKWTKLKEDIALEINMVRELKDRLDSFLVSLIDSSLSSSSSLALPALSTIILFRII